MSEEFVFNNGRKASTIKELLDEIKNIDEKTFQYHVNEKKNDFATWINDVFKEKDLAAAIKRSGLKKDIIFLLQRFIKKGHHVFETIIIGAGIAGMAAAIYASRKRMDYLLLGEEFGGQMSVAGEIENYPGITKTNWIEFTKMFEEQMKYNDVEVRKETVIKVEKLDGTFRIKTNGSEYESDTIIICSGARARKLNIPGEERFANKGVTYCAICDGPLFKEMDVAVVGGGDAALEAVDFLMRIAKKIHIITINPELRGHEYLIERVLRKEKVVPHFNSYTKEIIGDKFVSGIKFEENGKMKEIAVRGIFVEIGRIPNTEFLGTLVDRDKDGHIVVNKYCETNCPGIYAAGDCADIHEYQFAISAGQGVTALLRAAGYLQRKS
ncbi:MAG: DUF5752 family protein [Candidatus Woesearchaeota archaeon]